GMLGEWASHADLHGKNAVGLMVRRERVQLLETIERSREIYGPLGARYNDQDKMWRWSNGARLRFAYLECDADADAYQGHSYTRVYVEELGTFRSASPLGLGEAVLSGLVGDRRGRLLRAPRRRRPGQTATPRRARAVPGVVRRIRPERRAQDDRRGGGRGDRPERVARSQSAVRRARSRVLQGGWRALDRGADQQGTYCGSSAAIPRRR